MLRFVWPILMFVMTGVVWQYNSSHDDAKLLVPGIHALFPSTAGDPAAMGEASVTVMIGVSTVFLLWTVVDAVRAANRREAVDDD